MIALYVNFIAPENTFVTAFTKKCKSRILGGRYRRQSEMKREEIMVSFNDGDEKKPKSPEVKSAFFTETIKNAKAATIIT